MSGCGSGGTAEPVAVLPAPDPVVSDPSPPQNPPPVVLTAEYFDPNLALEPLADCQAVKDLAADSLLGQFLATEPNALSPRPLSPAPLPALSTDESGMAFLQRGELVVIADGTQPGTLTELARFEYTGTGTAGGIFLDDARDRVIGVYENAPNPDTGYSPYGTSFVAIDITDPGNPVEAGRIWLEGERLDLAATATGYRIVNRAVTDRGTRIWFLSPPLRDLVDDYRAALDAGDNASADAIAVEIEAIVDFSVDVNPVETFLPFAYGAEPLPALSCTDVYAPNVNLLPGLSVVSTIDVNAGLIDRYAIPNNSGDVVTVDDTLFIAQSTDGIAIDDGTEWTAVYAIGATDNRPDSARYGAVSLPVTDIEFARLDGGIGILGQRFGEETKQDFYRLDLAGNDELVLSGEVIGFSTGLRLATPRFDDSIAVQVLNGLVPYWYAIDANTAMEIGPIALPQPVSALVPLDDGRGFSVIQTATGMNDTIALLDMAQPDFPSLLETTRLWLVSDPETATIDMSRISTSAGRVLLPVRQASASEDFVGYAVVDGSAGMTTATVNHTSFAFEALCGNEPALALPPDTCGSNAYLDWLSTGAAALATMPGGLDVIYAESSIGLTATMNMDGSPLTSVLILPYFDRP